MTTMEHSKAITRKQNQEQGQEILLEALTSDVFFFVTTVFGMQCNEVLDL
jgi:hypothetical protein